MEIKPKIGFDDIKFGMHRDDILEILGEPDRIVMDIHDGFEQRLEWNKPKIRLTFHYEENDRLTNIISKNCETQFLGKKLMGMDIREAKSQIFGNLTGNWKVKDYEYFETHFNEDLWLTLCSEFGKVVEVEMGVPFKNEEEYDWPL